VHKPTSSLTERESQIVALVAKGYPNREIATRLGLSPQTVKNQLSVILDKLGLTSRVQLAVYAVRHQLDGGEEEKSGES
jgi:two-component system, NarL family, response regulator DevR